MSTYSKIYIHVIFSVKGKSSLIRQEWEERLFKYITGIVKQKGQKLLAINGMPDHIHMLLGMKPSCCLSDLVREIKKSSNEFINDHNLSKYRFAWQEGFGAFSYSHSQLSTVIGYIMRQKEHHRRRTFREEYMELLSRFDVAYEEKYLFKTVE